MAIYQSGLKIDRFLEAAESRQAVPVSHLAQCYREGDGFRVDHNMAVHLDIIAATIEMAARKLVR
ncbi:hypothetical protein [Limimaricola litoreus]|uniref:Uncharacterized protein n=1 Tax=Limimaricola litoreus TaxID=2955316 RepID=A0A9X2JNJ5_9RHOB|nr:hypothetical protein [Limimaricola litoreus]MCP1168927.1 hypothetical protein [Limimaricola litoreus]